MFEGLMGARYYARDWRWRHAKVTAPALEGDGDSDVHIKTEPDKHFDKWLNNVRWKHKRESN